MSKLTNTKTPNPNNPSALKPRYEIRRLEPQHCSWAAAIVAHSNGFHSPVWPVLYPNMAANVHKMAASEYMVMHQINSGMSFGVFDAEYQYKTEEAKKAGGKLYWDSKEPTVEKEKGFMAEGERLLAQMDFPLVSVALAYDTFNALDMDRMKDIMGLLPQFGLLYQILASKDPRDPESWKPTGPGQVLSRNATSTRRDYEGQGLMGGLARWLMREAAQRGYRGINIECVADAVTHVWSEGVEKPFKGTVISEFECETWTDDEGKVAFAPAKQRITKCYVDLKPGT